MNRMLKAMALGAIVLMPTAVLARDAALIVVESAYKALPAAPQVGRADALKKALEDVGFEVTTLFDQGAAEMSNAVEAFRDTAARADRIVVFVAGHLVHTARDTWLLAPGADAPTDLSLGRMALPVGSLLEIAAERPGQALVMLAPSGEELSGPGISAGPAATAPQGVTLMVGAPARLIQVADRVLEPGEALGETLVPAPGGIEVSGFLSDALPFIAAPPPPIPTDRMPPPPIDMELAYWNVVVQMGTIDAYKSYLDRYPQGRFAPIARATVQGAKLNAEAQAEADEAALGLDRDARRDIQRALALLGYEPRGIDGVFGPATRTAIRNWQKAGGNKPTGYMTAPQVRALSGAAERKAAEMAAEVAKRKAKEEAADHKYWRETGRGSDEAGLRAYLERYPDGLYAEVAEGRLADIEARKRRRAEAAERAFWDDRRTEDTQAAYQAYLDRYPNGSFVDEAKTRIKQLAADDRDAVVAAAKAEEPKVVSNGVLRLLVENQLKAAGQDPGNIDGKFNKDSRRAIRRFQREQGLPVTGYVTQATMVRLLSLR